MISKELRCSRSSTRLCSWRHKLRPRVWPESHVHFRFGTRQPEAFAAQTAQALIASELVDLLATSELAASELAASELTASKLAASKLAASELTGMELVATELEAMELPPTTELAEIRLAPATVISASVTTNGQSAVSTSFFVACPCRNRRYWVGTWNFSCVLLVFGT
jgi:hypothetical protein